MTKKWYDVKNNPEMLSIKSRPRLKDMTLNERVLLREQDSIMALVGMKAEMLFPSMEEFAASIGPEVRLALAANAKTPGQFLDILSRDIDEDVRVSLARNRRSFLSTLASLALDASPLVREQVALNANTDEDTLIALAGDGSPDVVFAAAKNPAMPDMALVALAHSADARVRYAVAFNRNTPSGILGMLSNDDDVFVSRAAQHRLRAVGKSGEMYMGATKVQAFTIEHLPLAHKMRMAEDTDMPSQLVALAYDVNSDVRIRVARNINTPPSVLAMLTQDENADVRNLAMYILGEQIAVENPRRHY
jgi:hypothetical protein